MSKQPLERPNKILIVDDEIQDLDLVEMILIKEGYDVIRAADGQSAIRSLQEDSLDLIIADIAMPHMNGYQLYEKIRDNPDWSHIPFIFLTIRDLDSDIRFGKSMGVDDYLTKPILSGDLVATVAGRIIRNAQLAASTKYKREDESEKSEIKLGQLRLSSKIHRVWLYGEEVSLSVREFELLRTLMSKPGIVISSQDLVEATHNIEVDFTEAGNLIRPFIRSVRNKLGLDTGENGFIETVRGAGYRLNPEKI